MRRRIELEIVERVVGAGLPRPARIAPGLFGQINSKSSRLTSARRSVGQNGDIAAMGPVALKPFLLTALDRAGNSSGEHGLDKRYPIEPRNQGADFQPATTLDH